MADNNSSAAAAAAPAPAAAPKTRTRTKKAVAIPAPAPAVTTAVTVDTTAPSDSVSLVVENVDQVDAAANVTANTVQTEVQTDAPADGAANANVKANAEDNNAYASSLRRIQRAAKRLVDHLKSTGDAEGRKVAHDIAREASKALTAQEPRQTGYQLFIKLNSPRFRQEIESDPESAAMTKGAHTQMVFRKIAESWRNLDDSQKKQYNDMVANARQAVAATV